MKWFENIIEQAKQFIESEHSLAPVFFFIHNGQLSILDMSIMMKDKDEASEFLRFIVKKYQPTEYLLLMESYFKKFDKDDSTLAPLLLNGTLSVSQLPSSQEGITVLYGDQNKEKIGHITFQRIGKQVIFESLKWFDGTEMKGRFVGLRKW